MINHPYRARSKTYNTISHSMLNLILQWICPHVYDGWRDLGEVKYEAAQGKLGRVIVARLLPGTDLIEGVEKICKDYAIRYALVNCAIGALQKSKFVFLILKPDKKEGTGGSEPLEIREPVELLGGTGLVCEEEGSKEKSTHFHGTIADKLQRLYGGHLLKGGNPTHKAVDLVITELEDVKLTRRYDKEKETLVLVPRSEQKK